jgi:hypothetical protein
MSVPEPCLDANYGTAPAHQTNTPDAIGRLLAGLERQKEELGPIADELISLLHRLQVGAIGGATRIAPP